MDKHFYFTAKDGKSLYMQEWKTKNEPNAVIGLIHGLGEHSGRYKHLGKIFNKQGISVAAIDLRGHGKTKGKRGHIKSEDLIWSDIDCFIGEINKRYPNKPLFLYGHSLGGEFILVYVLKKHPRIKAAICTAPVLETYNPVSQIQLSLAQFMNAVFPSFIMDNGIDVNILSKDKKVVDAYINDPLVHSKISARLGLIMIENGKWLLNQTNDFPIPLLLMFGSDEKLVSKSAIISFSKNKKNVELKVWDGLFHEIHNEPEQEKVLGFTFSWIKKHV